MSDPPVVLNEELSRFELAVDDEVAYITFTRSDDAIVLVHTKVPDALEGRGIGTTLVRGALAYVQNHQLTVVPKCPFVREYLERHPEEAAELRIEPASG